MADELFGAPIPQAWIERFQQMAQTSGRTEAELVREAFAQYLGIETSSERSRETGIETGTQTEMATGLNAQTISVQELDAVKIELLAVTKRLSELETFVYRPLARERNAAPATTARNTTLPNAILADDDDIEDEPDEILYDFLQGNESLL